MALYLHQVLCVTALGMCELVDLGHARAPVEWQPRLPNCAFLDDEVRVLKGNEGVDFKTLDEIYQIPTTDDRSKRTLIPTGCAKTCRFVPVHTIYGADVISGACGGVPVYGETIYQYVYACTCINPWSPCVNCDSGYKCMQETTLHQVVFRCSTCPGGYKVIITPLPTECCCERPWWWY
ncbi:uncharacterized protein [Amphiura filiformis]|uniref:uncharacterized protein n=1 Tax=Amphiura filiformis TaxID=82378 RepID=UPI003B215EB1